MYLRKRKCFKCVSPLLVTFVVFIYGADDVSISGFKDAISEQSATESATEAVIGQEQEGGVSPDTVSATSQSTDDPTKDIVRYKHFKSVKNIYIY